MRRSREDYCRGQETPKKSIVRRTLSVAPDLATRKMRKSRQTFDVYASTLSLYQPSEPDVVEPLRYEKLPSTPPRRLYKAKSVYIQPYPQVIDITPRNRIADEREERYRAACASYSSNGRHRNVGRRMVAPEVFPCRTMFPHNGMSLDELRTYSIYDKERSAAYRNALLSTYSAMDLSSPSSYSSSSIGSDPDAHQYVNYRPPVPKFVPEVPVRYRQSCFEIYPVIGTPSKNLKKESKTKKFFRRIFGSLRKN